MTVDKCIEKLVAFIPFNEKCQHDKGFLSLVEELSLFHPSDIESVLSALPRNMMFYIFSSLPFITRADTFAELSNDNRHSIFVDSTNEQREELLDYLTINELVNFFDDLSEDERNMFINLLNRTERKKVLSLLEFPESSAAVIMESEVIVLPENISIKKTIALLKQMVTNKTLYKTIYIVNKFHILIGYVLLEDLFFAEEGLCIRDVMKKVDYFVFAETDQEQVGIYMTHYRLSIIPVIDQKNHFLGVITAEIIARTIETEASEDIFRMASLRPIEHSYFETGVLRLAWQRGSILTVLLLLQSISTFIISKYTALLSGFLMTYIGMITSTGGNTSSQVSALVIQGLASGDLKRRQVFRFIKREILIALLIGLVICVIGGVRIYFLHYELRESGIVSLALFSIVFFSTILGSCVPFVLDRCNLDPAYSAGPLLATFMDVFGVILFTLIIYSVNTFLFF